MDSIDYRAQGSASRDAPVTVEYYARLVARRWWLPLSFVVLGVSLALVYTGMQNVAYQARSTILLSPLDPGTADELPRLTPTVARLVRSDAVFLDARRAYLRAVSGPQGRAVSLDDLRGRTTVRVPRDTSLFEVAARGPTQEDANQLVRAIVGAATRRIARLAGAQGGRRPEAAQLRVQVFGPSIPEGKVSPTPTRNLVLGANLGFLLGIAGALLIRDPRRTRIRADVLAQLLEASDLVYAPMPANGILGQGRLGTSPAVPGTVETEPGDRHAEGIRLLGGRLLQWLRQDRRVVLLLGDIPPQTLRSVALRLAAHLARTGINPVVLEADFHGGGWKTGGGEDAFGLGQALEAKGKGREPKAVSVETSSQNGAGPGALTVVPRGKAPADPALSFASDRYRSLIERFASRHTVVLVVGPATEWQAEVAALADGADGVVLFVPPWVPTSRAASMTTLRSIGDDTSLLVSVVGDPEAIPLTARLEG